MPCCAYWDDETPMQTTNETLLTVLLREKKFLFTLELRIQYDNFIWYCVWSRGILLAKCTMMCGIMYLTICFLKPRLGSLAEKTTPLVLSFFFNHKKFGSAVISKGILFLSFWHTLYRFVKSSFNEEFIDVFKFSQVYPQ